MNYKYIDFSKFSSIKIGGVLKVGIVDSIEDLSSFDENSIILGKANNLIISPHTTRSLFMLGKNYDYIQDDGIHIEIGARSPSGTVFNYFKNHNLRGCEFLQALPGSFGGLIKMNAGMKSYEIGEIIKSVLVYENGNAKWIENINFTYRNAYINGVILAAKCVKLDGFRSELVDEFKNMRSTHPQESSAGSAFKNPKGDFAGRILESLNLKGHRIGDMAFSHKHANFLVNLGNGTFEDAIKLINMAISLCKERLNIELECEVRIIA